MPWNVVPESKTLAQLYMPSSVIIADLRNVAARAFVELHSKTQTLVDDLYRQYTTGSISAETLGTVLRNALKEAYTQTALLGKIAAGKTRQLSDADMLEVMKQWANETKFVDRLVENLTQSTVSNARLKQRLDMYPDALREVFNASWANHKPIKLFRWHMHPRAEHCMACIDAASGSGAGLPKGVYRLEELPFFPGRSPVCLTNCMCWLEAADGDVGAPQVRQIPAESGEIPDEEK
jgi:hypothetical protein